MSRPALALVEPEVEAWQQFLGEIQREFDVVGGEILTDAASEVGRLGSDLASAPFSELMSELEERRGLEFKYFTPWHVKDRDSFRLFIRQELEKEYTPAKIFQEESVLKALGLVPVDFQLLPFTEELFTDSVAGVYDPSTDQFFIIDMVRGQGLSHRLKSKATTSLLGDMSSAVIIHELDHALCGQHFSLRETFGKLVEQSTLDQRLAVMALVEGDATFVMIDHQQKKPPAAAGSQTIMAGTDMLTDFVVNFPIPLPGMGKFGEAPLFFKKSLIFPYYGGAEFVSSLRHSQRAWEEVNACYRTLPTSTEQIFHPDRYLHLLREPQTPNFSKLPEPFGDWHTVVDETGGEFLVRVVLEQYGVENYRDAADGWHGDKLRVFRHQKTGALGFYWAIRWDNMWEAEQFYRSLGSHLPFVVQQEEEVSFISLAFTGAQLTSLREALGDSF
jgi:hypothetical protein